MVALVLPGFWQLLLIALFVALIVFAIRAMTKGRDAPTNSHEPNRSDIERVIQDYGMVLGQQEASIRPVSVLPYPKSVIEGALLAAMRIAPAGNAREQLKVGFILLADFQDMTPDQRAAVAAWDAALGQSLGDSPEEVRKKASVISEAGSLLASLREKVARETSERSDQLKAEGLV